MILISYFFISIYENFFVAVIDQVRQWRFYVGARGAQAPQNLA